MGGGSLRPQGSTCALRQPCSNTTQAEAPGTHRRRPTALAPPASSGTAPQHRAASCQTCSSGCMRRAVSASRAQLSSTAPTNQLHAPTVFQVGVRRRLRWVSWRCTAGMVCTYTGVRAHGLQQVPCFPRVMLHLYLERRQNEHTRGSLGSTASSGWDRCGGIGVKLAHQIGQVLPAMTRPTTRPWRLHRALP